MLWKYTREEGLWLDFISISHNTTDSLGDVFVPLYCYRKSMYNIETQITFSSNNM